VPLNLQTSDGKIYDLPLKLVKSNRINVPSLNLIANVNSTGFYRVQYTGVLLDNIIARLSSSPLSIDTAVRASIVDDIFSFLMFNMATPEQTFDLISFLKNETDYVVWTTALSGLTDVRKLIELESCYGLFQNFGLSLVSQAVSYVGWQVKPEDSHVKKLLRPSILRTAAIYGHTSTISTAINIFHQFIQDPIGNYIHPDLRSVVYETAIENGGQLEFDFLLNRAIKSNVNAEQVKCLVALTKSRQLYLLQRALDLSINPKYVRPQETLRIISNVAYNPYGQELAWNFFRQHFQELVRRYSVSAGAAVGSLLQACTKYFASEVKLKEVLAFLQENPFPEGSRSIQQGTEQIQSNIDWLSQNRNSLQTWLQNWGAKNSSKI